MNNFGFSQCGVLEIVGRDPDSRGFVLKPGSRASECSSSFTCGSLLPSHLASV
jgi:hypothetical protein